MRLGVFDFQADSVRFLVDDAVRGWYTQTGHLMYVRRDGAVFAARFDLDALELAGPGIPLFQGVAVSVSSPEMVVAQDGTILYSQGVAMDQTRQLAWVDRRGEAELVDPRMDQTLALRTAALSPDGTRAALTAEGGANTPSTPHLWVKELPDGPTTRLTTDSGFTRRPAWAPDGRSIAYVTDEGGTYEARRIRADGSSDGAFDVLLRRERGAFEVLLTRDGDRLVFREGDNATGDADIMMTTLGTDAEPIALVASSFSESAVALSPDNRWMAYESDVSGRTEVFVRPFPDADSRVPVSTSGGASPVWAHNGQELFYVEEGAWLTAATYETSPSFRITGRERLFQVAPYFWESGGWRAFDVSLDDQRFLMISVTGGGGVQSSARMFLLQNYFTEMEERVGG
jgi:serine/threonine-protein kinase